MNGAIIFGAVCLFYCVIELTLFPGGGHLGVGALVSAAFLLLSFLVVESKLSAVGTALITFGLLLCLMSLEILIDLFYPSAQRTESGRLASEFSAASNWFLGGMMFSGGLLLVRFSHVKLREAGQIRVDSTPPPTPWIPGTIDQRESPRKSFEHIRKVLIEIQEEIDKSATFLDFTLPVDYVHDFDCIVGSSALFDISSIENKLQELAELARSHDIELKRSCESLIAARNVYNETKIELEAAGASDELNQLERTHKLIHSLGVKRLLEKRQWKDYCDTLGDFVKLCGKLKYTASQYVNPTVVEDKVEIALKSLGLPLNASPADINRQKKRLMTKYHPDPHGGTDMQKANEEKCKEIMKNYLILKEAKRV